MKVAKGEYRELNGGRCEIVGEETGRRIEMAGEEEWWAKRNGKKKWRMEDTWGIPNKFSIPKIPSNLQA